MGYGLGYVYKQPELTTTSFNCMGGENYNGKWILRKQKVQKTNKNQLDS